MNKQSRKLEWTQHKDGNWLVPGKEYVIQQESDGKWTLRYEDWDSQQLGDSSNEVNELMSLAQRIEYAINPPSCPTSHGYDNGLGGRDHYDDNFCRDCGILLKY